MQNLDNEKLLFNFADAQKSLTQLVKEFEDNKLNLDDELISELMGKNILIYEKNFFNKIKEVLKSEYDLENVYLMFADCEDNFNVITCPVGEDYLIIYSVMFFQFINSICLYVLCFYEFSSSQKYDDSILNKMKNNIIGIIDLMINRNKSVQLSDFDYNLYKNEDIAIKSAIIARNIQAFIICHELSHILFDKKSQINKFDRELNADENGMCIYAKLIENMPPEYNLNFDYSRAPLILFELLDFIDYCNEIICDNKKDDSMYPIGEIRKCSLLSKTIFSLENTANTFFYVAFTDTLNEVRFHLFKNKEIIKENIERIRKEE